MGHDERFRTTRWSQVLAAGRRRGGSDRAPAAALAELCEAYWTPLYVFLRRHGLDADEARDRTQGFFVELLESDLLAKARPERGRFRSFLLGSLKNSLSHEGRRERAAKRGGAAPHVSLDVAEAERCERLLQDATASPERAFESQWAATLVGRARERLRRELTRAGREDHWRLLGPHLLEGEPARPYREIAETLDATEPAIKMAVRRLRQRFGRLLRDEIADTVDDPEAVDDELRHLLEILRGD